MANPFTAFAFDASGSNQSPLTLPDRLAQIKNVKDFGATGAGFPTDDWAAIQAAVNWNTASSGTGANRGIIYFPPGNYYVSQTISFEGSNPGNDNVNAIFLGEMNISTVTGNFTGFVFDRPAGTGANTTVFDKLTVVNTNATGGGIRLGGTTGSAIRNCNVTANQAISTYNGDLTGFLDNCIENCVLSPGSNVSGSIGIADPNNGPILNCRIIGFENGIAAAANEGAQCVMGCYIANCTNGISLGLFPGGTEQSNDNSLIAGCWFKNNSVAINCVSVGGATGLATFLGLRIEGTNGQAPGGANPQYGILCGNSEVTSFCMFAGITVTGQYDVAGIFIAGSSFRLVNTFWGVNVTNTSTTPGALPWSIGASQLADGSTYTACNVQPVYKVAQLPSTFEGDCYNVSDATNGLAWGATVTNTGTHTTHNKVRYNGTNFTVVGQ